VTERDSLILGVETATLGGSVSVTQGHTVLATKIGDPQISHSNTLLRDIEEILQRSNIRLSEIDLFAAACGPGSFTGLRIGLATVKGLAAMLRRPCAGVPTLQAIARAAGESRAVVALLPAGRGEVFAQLLSVGSQGNVAELDVAAHLSPPNLMKRYAHYSNLKWAGPGAHLHRDIIMNHAADKSIPFSEQSASPGWVLAPWEKNLANHVNIIAAEKLRNGQTVEADALTAVYLRPSDAELKKACP